MEEAIQRFVDWFVKFVVVAGVLLLSTHLIARSLRNKKKQAQSKIDDKQTQE